MSGTVGIDLSTKALDLVKLAEEGSRAEWVRCELAGKDAWERTLGLRESMARRDVDAPMFGSHFWDDVLLVAIEAPYGPSQRAISTLNRIVGAVAASLPAHLRSPDRCWVVRPDEWKAGLGLKGKPTWLDLDAIAPENELWNVSCEGRLDDEWQNARDAYCIALFARNELERGIPAAPGAVPPYQPVRAPGKAPGAPAETQP